MVGEAAVESLDVVVVGMAMSSGPATCDRSALSLRWPANGSLRFRSDAGSGGMVSQLGCVTMHGRFVRGGREGREGYYGGDDGGGGDDDDGKSWMS